MNSVQISLIANAPKSNNRDILKAKELANILNITAQQYKDKYHHQENEKKNKPLKMWRALMRRVYKACIYHYDLYNAR